MNRSDQVKFATTRWSIVHAARHSSDESSRSALRELYSAYWPPLYAFARRRGMSVPDAEDVTQGFFAALLAGNWLEPVDQQRGKFRTYLLILFKRFIAAEWRKNTTCMRGGNQQIVSLEFAFSKAEEAFQSEPICGCTAEQTFHYQWALTVLDRVWERLRAKYELRQQGHLADLLRPLLTSPASDEAIEQVSAASGKSAPALRVALHRLRSRYSETLRQEIADTVDTEEDVEKELSELLSALRITPSS